MTKEEKQKILEEAKGNSRIFVAGDCVEKKFVEYEIGNVEAGGTGIQINYPGPAKDDTANEQHTLSTLDEGPKLTTAAEKFANTVAPFCFKDLPLVKALNAKQQAELIELMVKDACYAAAMLKYLGYYDRLKDVYQMSTKERIIEHCAQALGSKASNYKKYFYSLTSQDPYSSTYEKHNAKVWLENGTIEKDYGRIKESK